MGALAKILIVIIGIALVYVGVQQFGIPIDSYAAIASIDSEFGVGSTALAPAGQDKIAQYLLELRKLNPRNEDERNAIQMKIELAEMQRQMLVLAQNYPRIDFSDPECSASGPLGSADAAAGSALEHARNSIEIQGRLRPVEWVGYLTSDETAAAINFSAGALAETKGTLDYFCGRG